MWTARLSSLCALVLTLSPSSSAHAQAPQKYRIDDRKIEITVDVGKYGPFESIPRGTVRMTYTIVNNSDQPLRVPQQIPVLLSQYHVRSLELNCKVHAEGQAVEHSESVIDMNLGADAKLIPLSTYQRHRVPNLEQASEWYRRLAEWRESDADMQEIFLDSPDQFARLNSQRQEVEHFVTELKRHLLTPDRTLWGVTNTLIGKNSFDSLLKLMPEVDPTLRLPLVLADGPCESALDANDPESYRHCEQMWRKQVEQWIAARPELQRLRHTIRQKYQALTPVTYYEHLEPLARYLHDQAGLTPAQSYQLADHWTSSRFRASEYFTPEMTQLVLSLFPDVRDQWDHYQSAANHTLERYGFDGRMVNHLTGHLYRFRGERDFYHGHFGQDPTVLAAHEAERTGRPTTDNPLVPELFEQTIGLACVVGFEVCVNPQSTVKVTVDYQMPISRLSIPHAGGVGYSIPGELQLVCVLDPAMRAEQIDLSISVAPGLHVVVSPAPGTMHNDPKGWVRYESNLSAVKQNIHLALHDFRKGESYGQPYIGRFVDDDAFMGDDPSRNTLQLVRKWQTRESNNLTIAPLLKFAESQLLFEMDHNWQSREVAREIRRQYPNFTGVDQREHSDFYARDFERRNRICDWIDQKVRSPIFNRNEEFGAYLDNSLLHLYFLDEDVEFELSRADRRALAKLLQSVDEHTLTPRERLGRRFVLCHAGIDLEANLSALVKIAEADESLTLETLRMIGEIEGDKLAALPFVTRHFVTSRSANHPTGKPKQKSELRYLTEQALRTFDFPQAAGPLIAFIRSSDSVVDRAVAAHSLWPQTLPELFDELVDLWPIVSDFSRYGKNQYLQLLVRSDSQKSIPILQDWRVRHPDLEPMISVLLYHTGQKEEYSRAIEVFNTSDDPRHLAAAAEILCSSPTSDFTEQIIYRNNVPHEVNQKILEHIAVSKYNPGAFPFVEGYYRQYIQSNPEAPYTNCVRALVRTGDPRAIPFVEQLVAMFGESETKARALADLRLGRRPTSENPRRDLRQIVGKLTHDRLSTQARTEALEILLQDPSASIAAILERSGIIDFTVSLSHRTGDANWSPRESPRFSYFPLFGLPLATEILKLAHDIPLYDRDHIAKLLTLFDNDVLPLLYEAASNENADEQRRRTAILALGMRRDPSAVPILAPLLDDEALRGNVIDALALIGNDEARRQLRQLQSKIPADGATPRERVWQQKLAAALASSN